MLKIRIKLRKIKKLTNVFFSKSYVRAFVILNLISLFNLHYVANTHIFISQFVILLLGLTIGVIISNVGVGFIKKYIATIYVGICSLVMLVSFIGIKVNGARRWLRLFGFTFQPTELLKLVLIITIACFLDYKIKPDTRKEHKYNLQDLIVPILLMLFPIIFVLKQPDLGTAIICALITISILLFVGIERKTLCVMLLAVLACSMIGWKHLKPYQKDRIVGFVNMNTADYHEKGWQAHQSLITFGSGGIVGRGGKKGLETQLGYLPEAETDFAFASLAEEHGFLFVVIVLGLICYIIMELLFIAGHMRDVFGLVVVMGIVFWLGHQAIINTMMVCGLAPIVGIQFPVISYGGSGLLSLTIAFGIIVSIENKRNKFLD